jgi:hypothetical protein
MKFEKAFAAVLETLSVAMTAANSTNPVVFFLGVETFLFKLTRPHVRFCVCTLKKKTIEKSTTGPK